VAKQLDNQNDLKEKLKQRKREREEFGRILSDYEREQEYFKKLKREEFPSVEDDKLLEAASAWIYEKAYS
jgi:hypothetical protein